MEDYIKVTAINGVVEVSEDGISAIIHLWDTPVRTDIDGSHYGTGYSCPHIESDEDGERIFIGSKIFAIRQIPEGLEIVVKRDNPVKVWDSRMAEWAIDN